MGKRKRKDLARNRQRRVDTLDGFIFVYWRDIGERNFLQNFILHCSTLRNK